MSPVIDSRLNFGLARLQRCLFAVGGSTIGEKMTMLSSVERFDPKFNSWEKQAPLSQGKKGAKGIVGTCNVIFHTNFRLILEMESRSRDRKIRDRAQKTNKQTKQKRKLDGSGDRNNGSQNIADKETVILGQPKTLFCNPLEIESKTYRISTKAQD